MKTYLEHLTSLPDSIAQKAIANMMQDKPELADRECPSLEHAILTGFYWCTAPEGMMHWAWVHFAAKIGEFDSSIPKHH